MSVERNKKFIRELKKESFINWKIIKHILSMKNCIRYNNCKHRHEGGKAKNYYFRKQIEVAKRKLKKS